jgi:hypothetical protein
MLDGSLVGLVRFKETHVLYKCIALRQNIARKTSHVVP